MANKQPFMKLFVDDVLAEPSLKLVSLAARGLWWYLLCLMHKSDRRGYLYHNGQPLDAEKIAAIVGGISPQDVRVLLQELLTSGVASACKHGDLEVIFNRRMVRESDISEKRAAAGQKGGQKTVLLKQNVKQTSKQNSSKSVEYGNVFSFEEEKKKESLCKGGGVGEGGLLEQNVKQISSKSPAYPPTAEELPDYQVLSYYQQHLPAARRLGDIYVRTVSPNHPPGNQDYAAAMRLMVAGFAEDDLMACLSRYGGECDKHKTGSAYRKSMKVFFGQGVYVRFLQDVASPDAERRAAQQAESDLAYQVQKEMAAKRKEVKVGTGAVFKRQATVAG